jgi:hypothetical protein
MMRVPCHITRLAPGPTSIACSGSQGSTCKDPPQVRKGNLAPKGKGKLPQRMDPAEVQDYEDDLAAESADDRSQSISTDDGQDGAPISGNPVTHPMAPPGRGKVCMWPILFV